MHDIGKMKIAIARTARLRNVLLEAGETEETLLTATRDHHERMDGSGYPRRLTAEQISIPVRMGTLCDVFAAMTEPRLYAETLLSFDRAGECRDFHEAKVPSRLNRFLGRSRRHHGRDGGQKVPLNP